MPSIGWLELGVRWIHVIAGIAWIGASFYFNWLNDRLTAPEVPERGVEGELWSVHGGGFYRVIKYAVAPERLPRELHWFKWEAYLTWISGIALLILVYYMGADVYLLDPGVSTLSAGPAIALGVGTLVASWFLYDALCRSALARRPVLLATLGFLLVTAFAYGLTRLFGGRGAYIHVGATLGTLMAANVFRVIIPAHREMVDAVEQGREPEASIGAHAAMRSLHNNYLTLPVLFVMVSNHYPITYGHPLGWAILGALFLVGAVTRHAFNLRNRGRSSAWLLPAVALAMVAVAYMADSLRSAGIGAEDLGNGETVSFERVRGIVAARCSPCHSEQPSHELFDAPPGGVVFDTPEQIRGRTEQIYEWAVASRVMPLGNFTGMTDEERATLGRWIRSATRP